MEQVFSREKIVRVATDIPNISERFYKRGNIKSFAIRDRAFFSLLYLTGARVGEIVRRLRKNDINFETDKDGTEWMVVTLHTEKNPKHPPRNTPINIKKESTLVEYVKRYLNILGEEDILFTFNSSRAWQIIRNILDKHKVIYPKEFMNANHYLRHCRATHLVTFYGFNDQQLVKFFGWSSGEPAFTYTHLNPRDLQNQMKEE